MTLESLSLRGVCAPTGRKEISGTIPNIYRTTFGSGHRFDIYGEDRDNPTIKAFYEWWEKLVKPYEKEFDKDFNL